MMFCLQVQIESPQDFVDNNQDLQAFRELRAKQDQEYENMLMKDIEKAGYAFIIKIP